MDHPIEMARQLGQLLEKDPIATAQIKETIKPERLYELLQLEAPLGDEDDLATLKRVIENFSDAEVLKVLNERE